MKKLLILALALLGVLAAFTSCKKVTDPLAGTSWQAVFEGDIIRLQIGAGMSGTAYIIEADEPDEIEATAPFTYTFTDTNYTMGNLYFTQQGYYGTTTTMGTFTLSNNILYVTATFDGSRSQTLMFTKI